MDALGATTTLVRGLMGAALLFGHSWIAQHNVTTQCQGTALELLFGAPASARISKTMPSVLHPAFVTLLRCQHYYSTARLTGARTTAVSGRCLLQYIPMRTQGSRANPRRARASLWADGVEREIVSDCTIQARSGHKPKAGQCRKHWKLCSWRCN